MNELIEKIAGRFIVLCEDCLHGENLRNDCPHNDEDICMWQREIASEVIPIIAEEIFKWVEDHSHFTGRGAGTMEMKVMKWWWEDFRTKYKKLINGGE